LRVCAFASTAQDAAAYNSRMRRLVLPLFLLLLLAGGGYTAYWFVLAHRIEAGLGPWAEAQRAHGTNLAWQSVAMEGFPTAFRLRFTAASAAGAKPVHLAATAPLLLAQAQVWDLKHWQLSAPQGANLSLPDELVGFASASASGRMSLGKAAGTSLELSAHDVGGNGLAEGLRITGADVALDLPDHAPSNHTEPSLAASIQLSQLTLPAAVSPFGKEIETLNLAATLKGAVPPGKLRDALAAWRQDGGTIELTDGTLHWGALEASANGTLALDDKLQPIGALTATVVNHDAIVDAAVASGNLRARDAGLLKIVLGLMAKPGTDGRKQLTLPVSLQNDHVYLGPAQIAVLPRFSWE
jgi:hypothetical protein